MATATRVFRALADPTRRQILQVLKQDELAAGEIAAHFEMAQPSVSRHLSILAAAELISSRRDGNRILYRVESQNLAHSLSDFLSAVCPTELIRRKRAKRRASRKENQP